MAWTNSFKGTNQDPSRSRQRGGRASRLRLSPEQAAAIAKIANTARCDAVELEDRGDCALVRRFDVEGQLMDEVSVYPADEDDAAFTDSAAVPTGSDRPEGPVG